MIKCLIHPAGQPAFEADLPAAVLTRSPIVKDAVSMAGGEGASASLVLPFGADFCDAWAKLLSPTGKQKRSIPTETLLKGLQAADFFADERAVQDATELLAERMFPEEDGTCPPRQSHKRQKTGRKTQQYCNMVQMERTEQILQQLSPHLTSAVLVATSTSLARCISLLPRQMHPLAVSAKCCSPLAQQDLFLSHQNSLTHNPSSSPLTAESASTQAREAQQSFKCDVLSAASSLTHITTLELSSSFMTGLKNNKALQQSLRALFTSLSGLSALVFQDGVTSACVDILVPVLSSMTAVQHLGIINPEPRDSSTCWFATRRHSASYMQAEGGWGNQADSEESDPDSAGALLPPNCEPDEVNTTTAPGADVHAVNTLIKHLRVLPALTSLTLAGAKPDCSQVVAFCSALKQLTGLRGLVMTDCFVHRGSEAVGDGLKVTQRLGGALKKLKLLERLDLQGSLPGDIIDPILDSIAGLTHLSHLCMQSVHSMSAVACPLPHRVAADSAGFGRRLAPMLSKLKSLQFLDLSECYIPTSTMGDVVNAIAGLTCLTGLELQQISREECFWEYFSEKVTSLVDLEDLIVSMNPCITDANVGKLAESLAKLPKLQDLDMHCCRVGKVGASALAQHLTGMKALKTLRLQMNRIRPEGAQVLAECFKTMTQLQEVSLLDSDIGDEGERVIVGALEESRGPEWQGEMSLSVMEDNKDLRRYYFQTGLDWFERYWDPPAPEQPVGDYVPVPLLDNVEDPFLFFLMLHLMEG